MTHDHLKEASARQLDRVLSFFPRANTTLSLLLAIDTGMAGVLGANAPGVSGMNSAMVIASGGAIALIAASVIFLYRGAFPSLNGGHDSLIYFREIAKRTEHGFIDSFKTQTDDAYINDLLEQVWRNSEILGLKFDGVRWSFRFTALAVIPWAIALALFAAHTGAASAFLK